jgi:glycosyltransferase involved in cell wall biosynthesis
MPEATVVMVDSSTDRTAHRAESCGAHVIRQLPPLGYGPAMMAALRAASLQSDVVVTLDCDGTYPADLIPELTRLVLDEGWDLVNATRLHKRPKAMPLGNWLGNVVFAKTTHLVHGIQVTDVHTGMRAYRSSMLRDIDFSRGAALPVELPIKPVRPGYRVVEVAIPYRDVSGRRFNPLTRRCGPSAESRSAGDGRRVHLRAESDGSLRTVPPSRAQLAAFTITILPSLPSWLPRRSRSDVF